MGVEEEREALAELVGREPRRHRRVAVGDPVREREGELLDGGRARLADVVAGDRDRVPARQPLVAVGEEIGRQPHRRPRREDVVPARDVLLEDVVLHRAAEPLTRDALPLGNELVEEKQQRSRRVDRHRGGDLAERDPVEEHLHVGERVDRHPGAPDLTRRPRVVRVETELRGQIESHREPRLSLRKQVAEALVRLLRGGEAGVLADRPRLPAVHVPVGAAREREFAGEPGLGSLDVLLRVDRLDLDARVGLAAIVGRGHGTRLTAMRVTVRLFAGLRERAGTEALELDLPAGSRARGRLGPARARRRARRPPLRRQQGLRGQRSPPGGGRRGRADPAGLGRSVPAHPGSDRRRHGHRRGRRRARRCHRHVPRDDAGRVPRPHGRTTSSTRRTRGWPRR